MIDVGPVVRMFNNSPEHGKLSSFMQLGGGVTFVSSDAEVGRYAVVPDAEPMSRESIESQTTGYVGFGVGAYAPIGGGLAEILLEPRVVFVGPEILSASLSIGVSF
jgi:hypothetical protein